MYKHIIISLSQYLPSVGSIWGMLFYAVASYIITFTIVGSINYWVNKNIDV
jgi:hypothetical protein